MNLNEEQPILVHLRAKLILAKLILGMQKRVWKFFAKTSTLLPLRHALKSYRGTWKVLDANQPTPTQK